MGVNKAQDAPAPIQAQSAPTSAPPSWMSQYRWNPNWLSSQAPQGSTYTPGARPNVIGTAGRAAPLAKALYGYATTPGVTGAAGAADAASTASSLAAPEIAQTGAMAGIDADTGIATANTASDIAASNQAWLAGQGAGEAASSAGAGSAAGSAAGGATEGAAAGETGGSAGVGAGAGAALAFLPLAATVGMALTHPAVQLGANYWKGLGNNLQAGKSGQGYAAALEALNTPQSEVPQAIQQQVWQGGFAPQGQWGMPTPDQQSQRAFAQANGIRGLSASPAAQNRAPR